jgi:hypothetical protein
MADASIPSKTAEFIDKLQQGKNADAGEAFKDALRDKVASALEKQRVDVAGKVFKGIEPETFSAPKPAVTEPSARTDKIMDTDGKEIAFEPTKEPSPTAPEPVAPEMAPGHETPPDAGV